MAEKKEAKYVAKHVSCDGYDGLNVREKRSVKSGILRVIQNGSEVLVSEKPERGWYSVQGGGFVMAEYIA